jgi:hypothetical protein
LLTATVRGAAGVAQVHDQGVEVVGEAARSGFVAGVLEL